jgi:hypothetical protein
VSRPSPPVRKGVSPQARRPVYYPHSAYFGGQLALLIGRQSGAVHSCRGGVSPLRTPEGKSPEGDGLSLLPPPEAPPYAAFICLQWGRLAGVPWRPVPSRVPVRIKTRWFCRVSGAVGQTQRVRWANPGRFTGQSVVLSGEVVRPGAGDIVCGAGGGGTGVPSDRPSAGWVKARQRSEASSPEHREARSADRPRSGEGGRERGFRYARQPAGGHGHGSVGVHSSYLSSVRGVSA